MCSAMEIATETVRYGARIAISNVSMRATAQSAETVQTSLAKKQIVYGSWEILIQKPSI